MHPGCLPRVPTQSVRQGRMHALFLDVLGPETIKSNALLLHETRILIGHPHRQQQRAAGAAQPSEELGKIGRATLLWAVVSSTHAATLRVLHVWWY